MICVKISKIEKLALAGADAFRINSSHSNRDKITQYVKNIRRVEDKINKLIKNFMRAPVSKVKIKSAYWAVRMFGRWAINSSEPRKGI